MKIKSKPTVVVDQLCSHCKVNLDCIAKDAFGNKFCAYCGRSISEKEMKLREEHAKKKELIRKQQSMSRL